MTPEWAVPLLTRHHPQVLVTGSLTAPDVVSDDQGPETVQGVQSGAQRDRDRGRTGEKATAYA